LTVQNTSPNLTATALGEKLNLQACSFKGREGGGERKGRGRGRGREGGGKGEGKSRERREGKGMEKGRKWS